MSATNIERGYTDSGPERRGEKKEFGLDAQEVGNAFLISASDFFGKIEPTVNGSFNDKKKKTDFFGYLREREDDFPFAGDFTVATDDNASATQGREGRLERKIRQEKEYPFVTRRRGASFITMPHFIIRLDGKDWEVCIKGVESGIYKSYVDAISKTPSLDRQVQIIRGILEKMLERAEELVVEQEREKRIGISGKNVNMPAYMDAIKQKLVYLHENYEE